MKRTIIILLLGLAIAVLGGCTKPAGDSNSASKNAAPATAKPAVDSNPAPADASSSGSQVNHNSPSASTATQNGNAASSPAAAASPDSSKLIGTYEMHQMEKKGVNVMMSQAKIQIVFTGDGRYSLANISGSRTVHTESGQYRTEGDSLVFSMMLSDKTIMQPPQQKRSKFALLQNGQELRVISKNGTVAVFKRIG